MGPVYSAGVISGFIKVQVTCLQSTMYVLRAISGIVHAHHSYGGKRRLGPVFRPFSYSHQYRFQIRLRLVDVSAFSGQKSN